MVWVKVCGIRQVADLQAAEEAGADAVGLVLADSPRKIDASVASKLARRARIATFLVTVDVTPTELLDLAGFAGVSGVQPHGSHAEQAARAARRAGFQVLRPVSVDGPVDLGHIHPEEIPLLDAAVPGLHGGTGERIEARFVGKIERRWVMAGGLGPDNVAEAIAALRPWGVDASSGLESAPGVKDPERIRRYVEEAKSA